MTWTKLGDDFSDRPAMLSVSRGARLLLVELLVWSNKHLTDGNVPTVALRRLTDSEDVATEVDELERAGLLERTDTGLCLDWTDQEPAERVRARREATAERQRRHREKRDKTRDVTRDRTGYETAPRPDPARPEGSRAGNADASPVRELRCTVCSRSERACRAADSKVEHEDRHEFTPDAA